MVNDVHSESGLKENIDSIIFWLRGDTRLGGLVVLLGDQLNRESEKEEAKAWGFGLGAPHWVHTFGNICVEP